MEITLEKIELVKEKVWRTQGISGTKLRNTPCHIL